MPRLHLPVTSLATKMRLGFAVVTLMYAGFIGRFTDTLPWVLLVVVLDLVAAAVGALDVELPIPRRILLWALLGAAAIAAGLAFNFVGVSAVALAAVPVYHAGTRNSRVGLLAIAGLSITSALISLLLRAHHTPADTKGFVLWTLAIAVMGILGAWSARLKSMDPAVDVTSATARETRALLSRLHELASEHGTELDAPASASLLLEDMGRHIPNERSVVLFTDGHKRLQPLAFRGVRRIDPAMVPGGEIPNTLMEGSARVLEWLDGLEPRILIISPFGTHPERPRGVIVLERSRQRPFTDDELALARDMTAARATDLEAALLLASLRSMAAVEERRLLAQEMHDGIAQDLAALGFQIDSVRAQARSLVDPPLVLEESLKSLREELGQVIRGLRSRISDLNMTQRPDRRLSAVLSASVQSFGSSTGIATTITIREGQVGLPAHLEAAIFRVVMSFLDEAVTVGAARVKVNADLASHTAQVRLSHDGSAPPSAASLSRHLDALPSVSVREDDGVVNGVVVTVMKSSPD